MKSSGCATRDLFNEYDVAGRNALTRDAMREVWLRMEEAFGIPDAPCPILETAADRVSFNEFRGMMDEIHARATALQDDRLGHAKDTTVPINRVDTPGPDLTMTSEVGMDPYSTGGTEPCALSTGCSDPLLRFTTRDDEDACSPLRTEKQESQYSVPWQDTEPMAGSPLIQTSR